MLPCDTIDAARVPQETLPDLPEGVPALYSFYLYMSDSCNMCCRHCWIVPKFTGGKPDPGRCIDFDALREALREAKTLGLRSVKMTGGEPMLHPRFIEMADLVTAEGLGLGMETNGTLLTSEIARHLKDGTNMSFISLSLDGPDAETHDSFRGVRGAFAAALKGLEHLVDAGYKNTQLIMSVHRGNRSRIEQVLQLAAERGAASLKLNPVSRSGRGAAMHVRGEGLDFNDMMDLARFVYDDLPSRAPVPVYLNLPPALLPLQELRRTRGCSGDCNVIHVMGVLGTNEYALCGIGQTHPELLYGRLGRDSLREIWLGHPVIAYLRQALENTDSYPGICGRCNFARACRTGCVANNYVETGQLIAPNWMCAEADRRGLFPSSRAQRRAARTAAPPVPEVLCVPAGVPAGTGQDRDTQCESTRPTSSRQTTNQGGPK